MSLIGKTKSKYARLYIIFVLVSFTYYFENKWDSSVRMVTKLRAGISGTRTPALRGPDGL